MSEERTDPDWAKILWRVYWVLTLAMFVYCALQATVLEFNEPVWFLILLMTLTIGAPLWYRWRKRRRRTAVLAQTARRLELEFVPVVSRDVLGFLMNFPLMNRGGNQKATNGMHGRRDGVEFVIFDYLYVAGGSAGGQSMSLPIEQTVLYFPTPLKDLPDFALSPRGWGSLTLDRVLAGASNELDVDRGEKSAFAKNYRVEGTDTRAVPRVFGAEIKAYFAENTGWAVEVKDGQLLVYRPGKILTPDGIPNRIDRGFEIRRLLVK
jgi:hypothetical protein